MLRPAILVVAWDMYGRLWELHSDIGLFGKTCGSFHVLAFEASAEPSPAQEEVEFFDPLAVSFSEVQAITATAQLFVITDEQTGKFEWNAFVASASECEAAFH